MERYQSLQSDKSGPEKTDSSRTNRTDYGRDLQINSQPDHPSEANRTEQETKKTGTPITTTNSGPFKEVESKLEPAPQPTDNRQFPDLEEEEVETTIFNKDRQTSGKVRKPFPKKKIKKKNLQHELSSQATGSGGQFWLKL